MIYYTGIGSRNTPDDVLKKFRQWSEWLARLKLTLRSGGANGADWIFEAGCNAGKGSKEIYLPWEKFNNSTSDLFYIPPEVYEIAAEVYGYKWRYLNGPVKRLMARDILQVVGLTLDEPSLFIMCWTPDGCTTKKERTIETGGTGQAIAYANDLSIPIFNFKNENAEENLIDFLYEQNLI